MWQFRVIKVEYPDGDSYEVHNCNPESKVLDAQLVKLAGDSLEELNDKMVLIQRALDRPILCNTDFLHIKE